MFRKDGNAARLPSPGAGLTPPAGWTSSLCARKRGAGVRDQGRGGPIGRDWASGKGWLRCERAGLRFRAGRRSVGN